MKRTYSAKSKIRLNYLFSNFTFLISLLLGILFILLVVFITTEAIRGFVDFGFSNIIFTNKFNQTEKSFWLPFSVTLITSLLALMLALFFGVKTAIFIKFRLKPEHGKWVRIMFETLSGIPSVMFGLFAINSFGKIFSLIGISTLSIFNASMMLVFMVLPTIISMTLNALNSVDENLLSNPIALGNPKTRSIYKVYKKSIKSNILIIAIVAFSRAIGESMAVSMILQSSPNADAFTDNGFFGIFLSGSQSIGAFISTNMFSDSDPEKIRPLLYSFGFIMFIIIMILNIFITIYSTKKNKNKATKITEIKNDFYNGFMYIPNIILSGIERIFSKEYRNYDHKNVEQSIVYSKLRRGSYKFSRSYSVYKISLEWISVIICTSFLVWIVGDILVNGAISLNEPSASTFSTAKNSVGQSFYITLLVILVSLVISFPISLFISIYLSEYVKNNKIKNTITFFIDSISATPSILFGMFGVLFFIETLGWTTNGKQGNSLIAGILTLSIVILPTFIRTLEQALQSVSKEIRENSYALGNSKLETIFKLVIPAASKGITTSLVLTIGRILSETAPLYLTAGLSSSWVTALDRPGTTLTVQIYAQQFSPSPYRTNVQYEAAFLTIILVFIIVFIGYWAIPNWKEIKLFFKRIHYLIKYKLENFIENKFGKKGIIIHE